MMNKIGKYKLKMENGTWKIEIGKRKLENQNSKLENGFGNWTHAKLN